MTPATFQEANNLFISFTGGTGAHHISNMLSLCAEFEPKFQSENYFLDMLIHYVNKTARLQDTDPSGITAHFFDSTKGPIPTHVHAHDLVDESVCSKLLTNQRKNIVIGHHHEWLESYRMGLVDRFNKNTWMVCSVPKKDSLASKRLINLNFNIPNSDPYKIPYVYDHRLPFAVATETNAVLFDTDSLFTDSGSQYLREFVATNFGLVLPDEADKLHIEWMKWMKHLNDNVFPK